MICKCGETGELKTFNSFQYYFCPKCRDEIPLELVVPPILVINEPLTFEYITLADFGWTIKLSET